MTQSKANEVFFMNYMYNKLVAWYHVGPKLAKRDTWTKTIGITLAYAGIVGLWALGQLRINRWRLSRPDVQNNIGPRSFVNIGPTILPTKYQRWPNEWLLSEKLWENLRGKNT